MEDEETGRLDGKLDALPEELWDSLGNEAIQQALRAVQAAALAAAIGDRPRRIEDPSGGAHAGIEQVEDDLYAVTLFVGALRAPAQRATLK